MNSRKLNPFATRFIRPGNLEFVFSNGDTIGSLTDSFLNNPMAQIVGPHGSGKSTLLSHLCRRLKSNGWNISLVKLHDHDRHLPIRWKELPPNSLLAIDGFEMLHWWTRTRIVRWGHANSPSGCGLLVTTHSSLGLPTLYETLVSPDIAIWIVYQLMPDFKQHFEDQMVRDLLYAKGYNLREVLFALYDSWNERVRPDSSGS